VARPDELRRLTGVILFGPPFQTTGDLSVFLRALGGVILSFMLCCWMNCPGKERVVCEQRESILCVLLNPSAITVVLSFGNCCRLSVIVCCL